MKLLRIGVVVLVIGVSFLVATNLRSHSVGESQGSHVGLFGPYLFEPRETLITLIEVEPPENLTVAVVNQRGWNPTQNLGEADLAFVITGLGQADTVVFDIRVRGLCYVVVMTETGELAGSTELAIEQRGSVEDLLWASYALTAIGVVVVVAPWVRLLRHRKQCRPLT